MAAVSVREIMDPEPVTVRPDAPTEEVIRLLRRHELHGVPVVNEGGRCVGIVTEADLVIGDDEGDLHLPHFLELFGGLVPLEPLRLQRFDDRLKKAFGGTATDMMTPDPTAIEPDASVREAARIISESGHNRLPVVEHGRLVGMVSRVDVLGALVE
jgi:CBS domain-containing protein